MTSCISLLLVFAASVLGQTFTDCNPLQKSCPPNPALGSNAINCDFTQGACSSFPSQSDVTYNSQGAIFSISGAGQSPTLTSTAFIFFGRIDVEIIAAPGQGIVTSVVLQSSDLDEIDFEWLGGDNTQVQTNYFGKGNTATYDRGGFTGVGNPTGELHTYSVIWTSSTVEWLVDGTVVRTLENNASAQGQYPQTPCQIKVGTWVGGLPSNPTGTVQWAGGLANFGQGPFKAYVKSVKAVDYAGGDGPVSKGVEQYIYGDKSGSWQSIQVVYS